MLGFKLSHKQDLYKDVIASPDKDDPLKCRQDNHMESKYLTIKQTGDNFYDATNQNGFAIMHCNTRSLGKNLFLLHDILISVKSLPDIIAISETKLNDTTSAIKWNQNILQLSKLVTIFMMQRIKMGSPLCIATLEA